MFDRETGKPRGYGFCEFAGTSSAVHFPLARRCVSNHKLACRLSSLAFTVLQTTDHETAASAVRNLNNVDVGGRPLRIDLADSDPFLEGKTTVRGELLDTGGETRAQWREREKRETDDVPRGPPLSLKNDPTAFLKALPPGVPLPPGTSSLDAISHALATMNPNQLTEVLAQMKVLVIVERLDVSNLNTA